MNCHDCSNEESRTEDSVYLNCMKKLNKEQMKRSPMLVVEGIVCQSYYFSRFKKCGGCNNAISGCEKIFQAGCN
jgi:hypothetical protein